MRQKVVICLLVTVLLTTVSLAEAQQAKKVPRISYITGTGPDAQAARLEALRQALRELGYVEGKNIAIESRYAHGKLGRRAALAAELVHLKVDVILSAGPAVTRAARKATNTIPIVMSQNPDPVGNGFVASLARPGGNITGLSSHSPEITGKQLELLKEIVPRLSRVAVVGTSTRPGTAQQLRETELAAEALGVKLQFLDVLDPKDIESAFRAAHDGRADAILSLGGGALNSRREQVVDLAVKSRVPTVYNDLDFVEAGGLMTYGVSYIDMYRRATIYVDKILKGAKPADLPVEQPTKFELVINLKTARQIGLTIPETVLFRADRITK